MATQSQTSRHLSEAKEKIKNGKGNELMNREVYEVPITAYRYVSLAGYLGDDDMFSSDIPEDKMKEIFRHISIPTLWIFSGADQYVPPHVNIQRLSETIKAAVASSQILLLEPDHHEIDISTSEFIGHVVEFLK